MIGRAVRQLESWLHRKPEPKPDPEARFRAAHAAHWDAVKRGDTRAMKDTREELLAARTAPAGRGGVGMIQFFARRRFNYVDAAALAWINHSALTQHWARAAVIFALGVIVSAAVECITGEVWG